MISVAPLSGCLDILGYYTNFRIEIFDFPAICMHNIPHISEQEDVRLSQMAIKTAKAQQEKHTSANI